MKDLGAQLHQHAPEMTLLEAQARQGFAHVPEKTCENLLTKLEKEIPEAGDDCPERKTELALALAAAIKPDFTDVQAAGCTNAAFIAENPDVYSDLYVDSDALGDVVTATEAKALAEYAAGIQSIQARKELVL